MVSDAFGRVADGCDISVVIPARNERERITGALDALEAQRERLPYAARRFEVMLLVNDTDDDTLDVVARWHARREGFPLRIASVRFAEGEGGAGPARRFLFERCASRYAEAGREGIVASTDADSRVAPRWLDELEAAIRGGADAVTGDLRADAVELAALPVASRKLYALDLRYRELLVEIEAHYRPDPADPWPRHHHHTGASFAVTTRALRRCGGMPAVETHEDIALYDALRSAGCTVRHDPAVVVTTSVRLHARAARGMGERLVDWAEGRAATVEHPRATLARMLGAPGGAFTRVLPRVPYAKAIATLEGLLAAQRAEAFESAPSPASIVRPTASIAASGAG